ncbi:peptidoglycan/LPS O-acetylase OafA/YrhL [Clavibacter sp. B3I6]|uniref:acyltransferase family protein n=1 Tax=Clavibacter sp. B3I6 TaxID=3042268 RepID=UPI00278653CB|nr:acyltransferase [Clavibacter sp. B3I6]MDQ0743881.1 peptidoglycan/LPS O-acetylase OafA/YrhL [Clavibacter sp. B3I6]
MTGTPTSAPARVRTLLPGIEGLRGIAAVAVLLYHVQRQLARPTTDIPLVGEVAFFSHGVTLFFVLSGFLLFLPFARALVQGGPMPRLSRYAANRALRVFPGYVVVLLLVSLVLRVAVLPREARDAGIAVGALGPVDTLLNALLLQGYTPRTLRSGIEVAWTLAVEVSFYVVLPVVALLAARLLRGRATWIRALAPAAALLLVGVAGKVWSTIAQAPLGHRGRLASEWGATWEAVANRSILVHADLFSYGMAAAVILLTLSADERLRDRVAAWRVPAGIVAAALVIVASVVPVGAFEESVVAASCALLLLLVALPRRGGSLGPVTRVLELRWIAWLGTISFSVYLWHLPVIRFLRRAGLVLPDTLGGFALNTLVVGAVTLVLAAATYYAIERPALRLKPGSR